MNTHNIELPPLPPLCIAPSVEPVDYPEVAQALMDYARAAIEADRKRRGEPVDKGPWKAGVNRSDKRTFIESDDFTHDVRLYVDGDFADQDEKLAYALGIADQLNAAPQPAEPTDKNFLSVAELVKVPSDDLQGLSDRAYCQYIEQMRRPECLGWEQKVKDRRFGEAELKAHTKAGEFLGRHRAFSEAAALLDRYGSTTGEATKQQR